MPLSSSFTIICPPVDETVRYSRAFKPLGLPAETEVPDSITDADLQMMRDALQRMFTKANLPEERRAEMLKSVEQRREQAALLECSDGADCWAVWRRGRSIITCAFLEPDGLYLGGHQPPGNWM